MKVPIEAERARARGRRRHAKSKAAFFLWFLFMSQFSCLSSAENGNSIAPSHWSPARKARFSHTTSSSSFHASTLRTKDEIIVGRDDDIYEDDERIVHTGPNPLHN